MTCLVAVEHEDGVMVGCDSFLGDEDGRIAISHPKWWTPRRGMLIAYAGGFRAAQTAQHSLKIRAQRRGEDVEAYLVDVVANGIAATHRQHDVPSKDRDGSFLVAYRGGAYVVQDDYSVARTDHGYLALGAAESVALGALAATEGMHPRDRVMRALLSAARHSQHACEPFHVVDVPHPVARR
jgi:ATP-dependent protease HslVU (ClpYQ) peptidase subunit